MSQEVPAERLLVGSNTWVPIYAFTSQRTVLHNTRDKKLNKGWAFSSRYNKGSAHCCWNQWENSSHMLSPSFAYDGKIPSLLLLPPPPPPPPHTYFRTIYERNAVVFQLKQKLGLNLAVFIARSVIISYNVILAQMTISGWMRYSEP